MADDLRTSPDPEATSAEAAPHPSAPPPPLPSPAPSPSPPPRRWGRRVFRGVLSALLGITVGLIVAELAFSARDKGAFPHLNVYAPDERLGVRLRPGVTERVAFGGNPVTSVRINKEGFRGADWPPPAEGEILVIGDSQVFGLGVEEGETFSAELERALAKKGAPRAVLNAGVPTYGPPEFRAVIDEQLKKRRIGTVVYVVNMVNDLFEASRPNADRHRVWDGWAVRVETAPARVTEFPGRDWLFRQSHMVYALRLWLHGGEWEGEAAQGFTSEGTWADLLGAASRAEESRAGAERETARLLGERRSELKKAADEVLAAQLKLEDTAYKHFPELGQNEEGIEYRRTHGDPGDILIVETSGGAESARPSVVTAQHLLKGAGVRARIEKLIRDRAEFEATKPEWKTVLRSFEERSERQKRLAELHAAPLEMARAWSPLSPALKEVKAICDERGAKLLVVALPMDVQVSKEEWKKYARPGAPPREEIDMKPSAILMADLVSSAEALGAMAIDATPALAAAEPGAFLNADIHMTPKGHRALAEALVAKLEEAPPAPAPAPGLPVGRSFVPEASEWAGAKRLDVWGSRTCIGQTLREWVLLTCTRFLPTGRKFTVGPVGVPLEDDSGERIALGASVIEGGHGEVLALARGRASRILAPVLSGESLVAELSWPDAVQTLRVERSKDGLDVSIIMQKEEPRAGARGASAPAAPPPDDPRAAALCACHKEVTGSAHCSAFLGAPDRDCERTYQGDCEKLLKCSAGLPLSAPKCLGGWVNAGALNHCYKACGGAEACEVGRCVEWQGVSVCM